MELQSVLQFVLQEKKNILLTSFSEFVSRRQLYCNQIVTIYQAVSFSNYPSSHKPNLIICKETNAASFYERTPRFGTGDRT